jgi:NADH:ubiquinone oxidoreductase subunit E
MNNHPQRPSNQSEDRQDLLLLLKDAQRRFGYLSDQFMWELAESLGVTVSEVYGVATFYSFLSTRPQGRHIIRACKSLPCCLNDSHLVISSIEDAIGISTGETTPDGRFSFELVNCIGACDSAPAILVNDDLHTSLTPHNTPQILEEYE